MRSTFGGARSMKTMQRFIRLAATFDYRDATFPQPAPCSEQFRCQQVFCTSFFAEGIPKLVQEGCSAKIRRFRRLFPLEQNPMQRVDGGARGTPWGPQQGADRCVVLLALLRC